VKKIKKLLIDLLRIMFRGVLHKTAGKNEMVIPHDAGSGVGESGLMTGKIKGEYSYERGKCHCRYCTWLRKK
jgi:hypothetical protein